MKNIKSYMLNGILFVSVLGTLFHFVYEWSGNNTLIGLFTPVNESIWEHTKLIFFPMLIYSFYVRKKTEADCPCIKSAMILGEITGVFSIITLFYTYSGIIGFNTAFADISIFYVSVITAFYISYKVALSCNKNRYTTLLSIIRIILISLYIIFTFFPPDIPLFRNP